MSTKTHIQWTDATWNPIRGCSRVSDGCRNCYAESVAYRFSGPGQPYEGLVRIGADGKRRPEWNGQVRFVEEHLLDPLRWTKPRRIFVNSMSDLFHEGVTDAQLDVIFSVMAHAPQHTFQILTKRPRRMLQYLLDEDCAESVYDGLVDSDLCDDRKADALVFKGQNLILTKGFDGVPYFDCKWPLPNVWLGVSVENQAAADERIPLLLQTPTAVRFISAEPLLGQLDIDQWFVDRGLQCSGFIPNERFESGYCQCGGHESDPCHHTPAGLIDWVICGGESGTGARPMHPDWARSLRDQCVAAGTAFFFKQHGEFASVSEIAGRGRHHIFPDGATVRRVGKKAAGDLLDGQQWHQFPEVKQ